MSWQSDRRNFRESGSCMNLLYGTPSFRCHYFYPEMLVVAAYKVTWEAGGSNALHTTDCQTNKSKRFFWCTMRESGL